MRMAQWCNKSKSNWGAELKYDSAWLRKKNPTFYDAIFLVDAKNMGILEMAQWLSLYERCK